MKPDIHSYIRPGAHAHLVGIGGVSFSTMAEVIHNAGVVISVSELHERPGGGLRHPHRRRPRR